MANYFIYVHDGFNTLSFPISGTEAAWDAYRSACAFVELFNGFCDLVDGNTGEVIEDFGYEPEDDPDLEDYSDYEEGFSADLDMGFNPYLGAYDFEC